MNVLALLQHKLQEALTGLVADPAVYAAMLKPAQDARFGDYQANCAMPLAKQLGKPPREVAQAIVERLSLEDMLDPPEIAGPGFINLTLRTDWLAAQVRRNGGRRSARRGAGRGPSHLRHRLQFSQRRQADARRPSAQHHHRRRAGAAAALPGPQGHHRQPPRRLGHAVRHPPVRLQELPRRGGVSRPTPCASWPGSTSRSASRSERSRTPGARKRKTPNDPIAQAAREETAQAARRATRRTCGCGGRSCRTATRRSNASIAGSTCSPSTTRSARASTIRCWPTWCADLREQGIARESEGAVVVFFGEKDPPALIQKRDGAFTYTTTDLATIRYRVEQWKPDAILYVVDFRQALHFKNLFDIARRWGFDTVDFEHVSFGSVLGEDGKPIKTREGTGASLESLLEPGGRRRCRGLRAQSPRSSSNAARRWSS